MQQIGKMVEHSEIFEEEFFEEFFLPIIWDEALEFSSEDDDGVDFAMHARRRKTHPSGAGTIRDKRS
jgi:hypothetical protein